MWSAMNRVAMDNGLLRWPWIRRAGTYRNIVIVTTTEEPQLILDSEVKMYGRCTGSYTVEDSTGASHAYPSFELLFWE